MRSFSVPGNLLLLGEYAVLEEEGLGFAAAPDVRITGWIEEREGVSMTGRWPSGKAEWTEKDQESASLFSSVYREVSDFTGCHGLSKINGKIIIDSSAFFSEKGEKMGFGSSAAVSAAAAAVLLYLSGTPLDKAAAAAPGIACSAHRKFQGNRGSGYDVFCSFYGGTGIFRGGKNPGWQPVHLPWLKELILVSGKKSVSSKNSIGQYSAWKKNNPKEFHSFLTASNECVSRFAGAEDIEEALFWFKEARRIGVNLGERIGVPAEFAPPEGLPGLVKSLGAGDELGFLLASEDNFPAGSFKGERGILRFPVAKDGFRWI